MKKPICHKCDHLMHNAGKAQSGNVRWKCSKCKTRTTRPDEIRKGYDEALVSDNCQKLRERIKGGLNNFIITCATNNTVKHGKGLQALETYAKKIGAQIIVVPNHYKNKDKFTAAQIFNKRFSPGLEQYMIDQKVYLGGGIELRAEISIEAPAVNPLQGKHAIGGARSTIYGHPQLAMKPVGTPGGMQPKRMWATGCINRPDYSISDRGAKAEFHHTIGALLVEARGNRHWVRQLLIDSKGGFYDLDKRVDGDKITKAKPALALVTGDEHELWMCPKVKKATYGKGGIVDTLKPKYLVRHDVLDGYAGSHHHKNSPLTQFAKHHKGLGDYRKELDRVVKHLDETTPSYATNLIVHSNHHDHLDKWLDSVSPNSDHLNALLICEMQKEQREAVLAGKDTHAFRLYVDPRVKAKTVFLSRNKAFMVGDVDVSQHSDVGVNGSRGSAAAFTRTVYKKTIGHGHGAHIEKGVWQAGTSTGRLEYERGYGTHCNTHIVHYANGKRATITINGNKWRG